MKVLLVNGSPRQNGCTHTALCEIQKTLEAENIKAEIFWLGNKQIRDCIACGGCVGKGKCVFGDDAANELIEKAAQSDGFVFGSPVYYAHPTGRLLSVLDRAFYAGKYAFMYKPAAAIVSARRGGTASSFDVINKYFTISNMPVVSSQYWNCVHGRLSGEAAQDAEGLQTMRVLARNMARVLRAGLLAGAGLPEPEERVVTSFIR